MKSVKIPISIDLWKSQNNYLNVFQKGQRLCTFQNGNADFGNLLSFIWRIRMNKITFVNLIIDIFASLIAEI